MPNKPDKFGIKFWLAVDVDTKYILNAIPYLGKEESRAPSQRLSDWVVMNLMQPSWEKEEMLRRTTSLLRTAWQSNCCRRRQA